VSIVGILQDYGEKIGPWFLHGDRLGTLLGTVTDTLDAAVESLRQGLSLGQPLRCDSSALPILARDRTLRIYPSEPIASQRIRLSQWNQLHRGQGSHKGQLEHVAPYFGAGAPVIRIVHQDGNTNASLRSATWHTLSSDGEYSVLRTVPTNWDYDGAWTHWWRYWVILYLPSSWTIPVWDGGELWDDGTLYDSSSSTQTDLDIIAMFLEWQAAHAHLWGIILATDPSSFGPDAAAVTDPSGWTSLPIGNWGHAMSGGVMTRPPSAIWIYDRGVV
jgi:hypothetical protein